ncbi:MAG: ribosomal RNA small subunit methyltransferase A [Armatimonadetes bacterium]|nr:ribosomal RNA small subunit methyltransferase A [Armatimonadota bacterium]
MISNKVIERITNQLDGLGSVLEVGPGPGVLTAPMSEKLPLRAVEVDERILPVLREMAPEAEVLNADALKVDLHTLIADMPKPVGLVSNMPYNITGPLLTQFGAMWQEWDRCILMMQKEVAQRILAKPGDRDRGSLSLFIQLRFSVKHVVDAPPGAFLPPPKVDSRVLRFQPRHDSPLLTIDAGRAEEIAQMMFQQPRKTLTNNLSLLGIADWLTERGLSPTLRPHELSEEDFVALVIRYSG